jgi:prolyl-tRNA editing enzyme YbaK/EbsC (Cys-tRNA(Pro) deacylase)
MDQLLPETAERVQQVLIDKGSTAIVRLLPDTTATALDAAKALNVPVSHIGKSIVFGSDQGVLVVVICGDQRVNTDRLSQLLQVTGIKSLRADEVKLQTGFVIGGVSPFGLPAHITIVIDSSLHSFTSCYVAAGHPKAVVQIGLTELIALTNAQVLSVATQP